LLTVLPQPTSKLKLSVEVLQDELVVLFIYLMSLLPNSAHFGMLGLWVGDVWVLD